MRRDVDLCRRIMSAARDAPGPVDLDALTTDADGRGKVGEHVRLLAEAGLIQATIRPAGGDPYYFCQVDRLTWAGHDWIEAVSSPGIWSEVKRRAASVGGSVAFGVLRDLADDAARAALGL